MGATCTILAAVKRPDLFKALVLIEPAMVAKPLALLARLLPKSVMNRTEPAGSTLKKRDSWPTRQAFLDHCRGIRGYHRFIDEAYLAMAEHGVIQGDDGRYYLAFPKIWEAHNYTQPPNVMDKLEGLSLPCLAVRGRPSVFFTQALWDQWQRGCPKTLFMEDLSSGHLLPLENPDGCSQMIASGVWDLLGR
jgi:pimeloyl-ACP methyl ester carboxylesterase